MKYETENEIFKIVSPEEFLKFYVDKNNKKIIKLSINTCKWKVTES